MNGVLLRSALRRPSIEYREGSGRSIPQAQKNRRRSLDQRRFSHARIPQQKQPPKERTGPGTPMYHGLPEMSTPAGYIFPKAGRSRPHQRNQAVAWCAGAQHGSLDGPGIMGDHGGAENPGLQFPDCQPSRKERTGGRFSPRGGRPEGRQKAAPGWGPQPPIRPRAFPPPGGRKTGKGEGKNSRGLAAL